MASDSKPLTLPTEVAVNNTISLPPPPAPSTWDRISNWVSENKAVVYTIAGVAVVATGAGVVYYLSDSGRPTPSPEKKNKKTLQRKKAKEAKKQQAEAAKQAPKPKVEEQPEEIPDVDENSVNTLDAQTRAAYAEKLKAGGNKAFGAKNYNRAIELYGKAILCKPDAVYYSNRAACYNALSDWEKVIEDTSAAISIDDEYIKAINRRANAYEATGRFSESLLDYTASCILDAFTKESTKVAVERLLKKVAEQKGRAILEAKGKKLPSPTFVTNYIQSFRSRPLPEGLVDVEEETGKGQLAKGLKALDKKTGDGYEEAARAFERAIELGDLDEFEALAYNMHGTFTYLTGDSESALKDLDKAIELNPSLVQSYIKRASLQLELANRDAAIDNFDAAIAQDKDDPDIYYHRAQMHFILAELPEAAKDYQKSIDLDSDFIYSHIQLGVTQYKLGSIASAMATFRRSIKNFENVSDVYNYYGELLLDQQKFQDAIEKFDRAVDLEKSNKPAGINVLPLINKALALFQWKQDFKEAEELCQKALIIDPDCDIAVATLAQLLLQQGKVAQALEYFERAGELARTEAEVVNAVSYAEATRAQLEVQEKYPKLAVRLAAMGAAGAAAGGGGFGA